jgi:hypothetical protein
MECRKKARHGVCHGHQGLLCGNYLVYGGQNQRAPRCGGDRGSCMDKCRVCVSTMYMPRAPEGAGCVVVIMVVTVEIIRPSVRAMAMLPLAALAAEKVWSMVTGTSMGLVLALSAVAVVAVVVGRVKVRC